MQSCCLSSALASVQGQVPRSKSRTLTTACAAPHNKKLTPSHASKFPTGTMYRPIARPTVSTRVLPGSESVAEEVSNAMSDSTKEALPGILGVLVAVLLRLPNAPKPLSSICSFLSSTSNLLLAVAFYQLAYTVLYVATGNMQSDNVGQIVGPLGLAIGAIWSSQLSAMQIASLAAAPIIASRLPKFKLAFLAAMVIDIIKGPYVMQVETVLVVFGISSVWKIVECLISEDAKPPLQELACAALVGWGIVSKQTPMAALALLWGYFFTSLILPLGLSTGSSSWLEEKLENVSLPKAS